MSESPIACDMSVLSPEQREAHLATSRELFSKVHEFEEVGKGYRFRLAGDAKVIVKAAEFILLENCAVRS
jgi:hypothetical protein